MNVRSTFLVVAAIAALTLSGCSRGIYEVDKAHKFNYANPSESKEAIIVFKAYPKNQQSVVNLVTFSKHGMNKKGNLYDRELLAENSSDNMVDIKAKDGFVVLKVDLMTDKEYVGVHEIFHQRQSDLIVDTGWIMGCDGNTVAFNVTEPGVYYGGDIEYDVYVSNIGELIKEFNIYENIESSKQFLIENYEQIDSDSIKTRLAKKLWKYDECAPSTTVIYY